MDLFCNHSLWGGVCGGKFNFMGVEMIQFMAGIICVFLGLTNIYGVIEGNFSSILSMLVCFACAIFNFFMALRG